MELKGFRFSAVEAAIKKPGRLDLALIESLRPATAAAVFTTNSVKAPPVLLSMERMAVGPIRALVVNSGNANACTGKLGMADALETTRLVARYLEIGEEEILVASTGVIGVPLPMDRLSVALHPLVRSLADGAELDVVARAIMTTDTFPKMATKQGTADGKPYTIAGVAKGSGMIMPNMATMLAFIVTDAAVELEWLEQIFSAGCDSSFNVITVDGDTSTNDMALILANGAAGNEPLGPHSPGGNEFVALLNEVLLSLAQKIVRDGEGATKFVTIRVNGALNDAQAKKAAMAIANSSLVKTAFFGQDANWGRILAAVGYSGATVDQDKIDLSFDDVLMARNGLFAGGDAEARGSEVLRQKEFSVTVDLKLGMGCATVYTSDLSHEYVSINADYRT
jgi:glutamate N-acetyltransferase / amino-acid N-acetyltransferase